MRTVISRGSGSGKLFAALVAGSLLLGAGGCGGKGDEEAVDKAVAGTELCGRKVISARAAKALKVITGSSRFEPTGEYTVEQAAANLVEAWPYPTERRNDLCGIYTPVGVPHFEIEITWELKGGPPPTGTPARKFTVLRMGEETVTAADKAYLYFACRTDRFPNATKAAHVFIAVERWGMPTEPEGDVEALKDAYATVAHSVSLAMAKELRCEGNGGLPARPVLDPV
jgi:hypothetical protein